MNCIILRTKSRLPHILDYWESRLVPVKINFQYTGKILYFVEIIWRSVYNVEKNEGKGRGFVGNYTKEKIKEYLDKVDDADILFLKQILTIIKRHVQSRTGRR